MKRNLKETMTRAKLMRAFEGESMGRNRYTIYSSVAKKEGYEQIASILIEIAENEREHAKLFFKYMDGDDVNMLNYPHVNFPSCLGKTKENLLCAAKGEKEEAEFLYPLFAKTAEEEGFKDIAKTFELIGKIEHHHMSVFENLAKNIENNMVFSRKEETTWICRKCGHVITGTNPPAECPVCHHDIGYFEILCECKN